MFSDHDENAGDKENTSPAEPGRNRIQSLYRSRSVRITPLNKGNPVDLSSYSDRIPNAEGRRPSCVVVGVPRSVTASPVLASDVSGNGHRERSEPMSPLVWEGNLGLGRGTLRGFPPGVSQVCRAQASPSNQPTRWFARLARFISPLPLSPRGQDASARWSTAQTPDMIPTDAWNRIQTPTPHPIRILLVEDCHAIQKVMKRHLKGIADCVVTVAEDGQHGLDLMKAEEFDMIITDFVMVRTYARQWSSF